MQMGNTLYYRLCWTTEMWILPFCHNWYNTITGVSPPRLGHKVRPEVFHWSNPNTFPAGQGVSRGFLGLSPGPSGPPGESICRLHTHSAHFQFPSWLLLGPSYVPVPGAHFFGLLAIHMIPMCPKVWAQGSPFTCQTWKPEAWSWWSHPQLCNACLSLAQGHLTAPPATLSSLQAGKSPVSRLFGPPDITENRYPCPSGEIQAPAAGWSQRQYPLVRSTFPREAYCISAPWGSQRGPKISIFGRTCANFSRALSLKRHSIHKTKFITSVCGNHIYIYGALLFLHKQITYI